MTRAVVYCRISKDATGEGLGVARQEVECRALAERRGLEVTAVYSDNSVSAYSGRKPRPGYEALLRAIRAGEVDCVITYAADRIYRRMQDLEGYIDACEVHGVPTYTVTGGDLDLTTPGGRMTARILGAVARNESEIKAARQKSANADRATKGTVDVVRRPFGWDLVGRRLVINEPEAEALRWAVQAIATGSSLREVARRWNRAGLYSPQHRKMTPAQREAWERAAAEAVEKNEPVPPKPNPGPSRWVGSAVRLTLRSPRLVGWRTYQGEVQRDEAGHPVRGDWDPVVSEDDWRACIAVLDDPARWTRPVAVSKMLLSGVASCSKCGRKIQSGGWRKTARGRVHRLRCPLGCVYRESEPVEDFVVESVLEHLASVDPDRFRPQGDAGEVARLRGELAELDRRAQTLALLVADGSMNAQDYRAAKARLAQRRAQVEAQLPEVTSTAGALGELVTAIDIWRVWEGLTDDQKRATIEQTADVVLVPPGTKENAMVYREAVWDGDALVKQAGMVANPDTVLLTWKI